MTFSAANSFRRFQSTLPARGATRKLKAMTRDEFAFQSTLPARGATTYMEQFISEIEISIHAPRTGSDKIIWMDVRSGKVFQSTLPARGATSKCRNFAVMSCISIHAPRTGSDTKRRSCLRILLIFQSTLPARGATLPLITLYIHFAYFNPRSPHGERQKSCGMLAMFGHFNPRSPHGERRVSLDTLVGRDEFQSTLPARGATPQLNRHALEEMISIHAPRTGSDCNLHLRHALILAFQSTLPARGATQSRRRKLSTSLFQSTLPARGATARRSAARAGWRYFNPRSPHGERQELQRFVEPLLQFQSTLPARGATSAVVRGVIAVAISIHAPRTGSDGWRRGLPRWGRWISIHAPRTGSDRDYHRRRAIYHISIHAPRTGSDGNIGVTTTQEMLISIHAPRTGSDIPFDFSSFGIVPFQSTLPARGATPTDYSIGNSGGWISIHAPRTGSDLRRRSRGDDGGNFNPRSPHGERRWLYGCVALHVVISIHAPRTGSDQRFC